jgi:hypothetical protein
MDQRWVSVRLKEEEYNSLNDLAKSTDRSRSAVLRRLIALAGLPTARQLLGVPSGQEPEERLCQTAK